MNEKTVVPIDPAREIEIQRPAAANALTAAVAAALDRATAEVLDKLERLSRTIQHLQAAIIASGQRAKDDADAHLDIAQRANAMHDQIEQELEEMRKIRG